MKLILASTSPNRRELFDRMGIAYSVAEPDYEEIIVPHQAPFEQVEAFALGKAESVYQALDPGIKNPKIPGSDAEDVMVMGFDSMIAFEGGSLGKAHSAEAAKAMLLSFAGKPQQVVSGFALLGVYQGKPFKIVEHQATSVLFRADITASDIDHYLSFNDWQGKCGAYSILGPGIFLLDSIEGDFQNIIGVPVLKMSEAIHQHLGVNWLQLLTPKA